MREPVQITQETLQGIFEDAGRTLRWKKTKYKSRIGTDITCQDGRGYLTVKIGNKQYNVHRLIWVLRHGDIPDGMQIDHIDGDKTNNSPDNLRLASENQNKWNRRMSRNNTSGVKGVTWNKSEGKWQGTVYFMGKGVYVGLFDALEAAADAVKATRARLHGEFANDGG